MPMETTVLFFAPLHFFFLSGCLMTSYSLPVNILNFLLPKPGLVSQSIPEEYQLSASAGNVDNAKSLANPAHFI